MNAQAPSNHYVLKAKMVIECVYTVFSIQRVCSRWSVHIHAVMQSAKQHITAVFHHTVPARLDFHWQSNLVPDTFFSRMASQQTEGRPKRCLQHRRARFYQRWRFSSLFRVTFSFNMTNVFEHTLMTTCFVFFYSLHSS